MRIALLYSGPYRGSIDILKNHLETFGDSVDIYVSCLEHYLSDWKNSGFKIKEYFITPNINFNETNWSKYRNDGAGQSGFWQFWNIKNLLENIPNDYDVYIKNRNDLVFLSKFNFKNPLPNTIYSPNNSFHRKDWDINTWINDEVLVFDKTVLNVLSSFVTDYYKTHRHSLNEATPYVGSNEASLNTWLKENNISIEKIFGVNYVKNHNGCSQSTGITGNYTKEP